MFNGIAEYLAEISKLLLCIVICACCIPLDLLCIIDNRPGYLIGRQMIQDKLCLFLRLQPH